MLIIWHVKQARRASNNVLEKNWIAHGSLAGFNKLINHARVTYWNLKHVEEAYKYKLTPL